MRRVDDCRRANGDNATTFYTGTRYNVRMVLYYFRQGHRRLMLRRHRINRHTLRHALWI